MDNLAHKLLHSPIMVRVLKIRAQMECTPLPVGLPSEQNEHSSSAMTKLPEETSITESTDTETIVSQWERYFEDPGWNQWKQWNDWGDWKDWGNWNKTR